MNIKRIGLIGGSGVVGGGTNQEGGGNDPRWVETTHNVTFYPNHSDTTIAPIRFGKNTTGVDNETLIGLNVRISDDVRIGYYRPRNLVLEIPGMLEIAPAVSIGTGVPDNKTVYIADKVYIDHNVHIELGFRTTDYFDISTKHILPVAIPFESLSNGNIKLGEREFMPATPSGDPLHYAYETAGAVYNGTTEDIIKTIKVPSWETYGEWIEEEVVHKAGYWMVNNIGDIDNDEMRNIYKAGVWANYPNTAGICSYAQGRTNLVQQFISTYYNTYNIPQSFNNTLIQKLFLLEPYIDRTEVNGVKFSNISWMGQGSHHITHIYGIFDFRNYTNSTIFLNMSHLTRLTIINLTKNIDFSKSLYIEKVSIKYMIDNATPTTPITITLHADRYAQLSEDADIVAALEAKNTALEGTGGSVSFVSA